jgi:hypothetical protein
LDYACIIEDLFFVYFDSDGIHFLVKFPKSLRISDDLSSPRSSQEQIESGEALVNENITAFKANQFGDDAFMNSGLSIE